jgi:hypothetical protein
LGGPKNVAFLLSATSSPSSPSLAFFPPFLATTGLAVVTLTSSFFATSVDYIVRKYWLPLNIYLII